MRGRASRCGGPGAFTLDGCCASRTLLRRSEIEQACFAALMLPADGTSSSGGMCQIQIRQRRRCSDRSEGPARQSWRAVVEGGGRDSVETEVGSPRVPDEGGWAVGRSRRRQEENQRKTGLVKHRLSANPRRRWGCGGECSAVVGGYSRTQCSVRGETSLTLGWRRRIHESTTHLHLHLA